MDLKDKQTEQLNTTKDSELITEKSYTAPTEENAAKSVEGNSDKKQNLEEINSAIEEITDAIEKSADPVEENTVDVEESYDAIEEITSPLEGSDDFKAFEGRKIEAPKKSKWGWLSYVLLAVAVGLGIYAMFGIAKDMGENPQSLSEIILGSNWRFALIFLAVIIFILFCDWMKYAVIMKTTTGRFNLRSSLKVQLLGKFYDNVTPFTVGGQPMQIYYLHSKGYSGGVSSAVVLIKYFTQMSCMCLISLLFLACNTSALNLIDSNWRILLLVGAWIGIAANLAMPTMVILFVVLPKFSKKIATFVITIGYKLKIVKDREKWLKNAERTVNEFRASFKIMSQKPLNFITLILLCVVEVLLRFALPYFVMKMFNIEFENDGISAILTVMALNVYATQSVTLIPTPGNSGAIESTGTLAFSAFETGNILTCSVFVWRLSVYYIYIIIGLGIMVFEFIRKLVRRRLKKDK